MTTDVKKEILAESKNFLRKGYYDGARVFIGPILTPATLKNKHILLDRELAEQASNENIKGIALAKKYDYLYYILGSLGVNQNNFIESLVYGNRLEDSKLYLDEAVAKSRYNTRKSDGLKKFIRNRMYLASKDDVISNYIAQGNSETKKKLISLVNKHGIVETLRAIKQASGNSESDASQDKNIVYSIISTLVSEISGEQAISILKKINGDNMSSLTGIKGLNELISCSKCSENYQEYLIGSLVDKFVKSMSPKQITAFFIGLDEGQAPFEVFNISDYAISKIEQYNYRSYREYKAVVMARAASTYNKDIMLEQYRRYISHGLIEKYQKDVMLDRYMQIKRRNTDLKNLIEYYNSIMDKRFIHIDDSEADSKEIESILKDKVQNIKDSDTRYSEFFTWTTCWADFKDRISSTNESLEEFILRALREESGTSDWESTRFAILENDSGGLGFLGGLALSKSDSKDKIKVNVWVTVTMRNIGIAREAIWLLAKSMEAAKRSQYRTLEFDVHKNNTAMIRVLESLGGYKVDNQGNDSIEVYEVDIASLANKTVPELRSLVLG